MLTNMGMSSLRCNDGLHVQSYARQKSDSITHSAFLLLFKHPAITEPFKAELGLEVQATVRARREHSPEAACASVRAELPAAPLGVQRNVPQALRPAAGGALPSALPLARR